MAKATASNGQPRFSEPTFTADPTKFVVRHPSDNAAYATIDTLDKEHKILPIPFPPARGGTEPVLTLAHVLGGDGEAVCASILASGQMVFHAVGDTGNTRGPATQNEVADKMVSDFADHAARDVPQFFLHLGDVVYSFGEARYYYDQFYDPYRNYPNPILALAGNHDGMVAPGSGAKTLDAFLSNFCAQTLGVRTAQAGGLERTAQIQPGVYFTFEAPFLRVIALYSNTLEDPGVISSQSGSYPNISNVQLDFLRAALKRVAAQKFAGALILAHHHPSFTAGTAHGWSTAMTAEIDAICAQVGVWPHAVLSAHAHNYQRFTRYRDGRETPYIVAGNGGHGLAKLGGAGGGALRTPATIQTDATQHVVLNSYDDQDYGYLRIVVDARQLRIEYHPASDGKGAKTPDDTVTIDLARRVLTIYKPPAKTPAAAGPPPATNETTPPMHAAPPAHKPPKTKGKRKG